VQVLRKEVMKGQIKYLKHQQSKIL